MEKESRGKPGIECPNIIAEGRVFNKPYEEGLLNRYRRYNPGKELDISVVHLGGNSYQYTIYEVPMGVMPLHLNSSERAKLANSLENKGFLPIVPTHKQRFEALFADVPSSEQYKGERQ